MIILDLLSNRYSGVARARFAALAGVLNWPSTGHSTTSNPPSAAAVASLEPLKARGWLVEAPAPAPSLPSETDLPEATQTLLAHTRVGHAVSASVRAWHCLVSAIAASWRLRRRSLLDIATTVGEQGLTLRERHRESSHDELVDAVSAYMQLRPLFFSARERCLHDSLTLVTFLAAEGIPARWVIGVRIRPFAAHSWVQHDGLVLNDQHERVRAYRPIFAV